MARRKHVLSYPDKKILFSTDKIYRIGRSPDNEIHLDERTVSGKHAKIFFKDDKWAIEDLNSSNGTLINYIKVGSADLWDCDRIMIGPFHCIFRAFEKGEIYEYDTLLSDTLILEKKIQEIFNLLSDTESKKKSMILSTLLILFGEKWIRWRILTG